MDSSSDITPNSDPRKLLFITEAENHPVLHADAPPPALQNSGSIFLYQHDTDRALPFYTHRADNLGSSGSVYNEFPDSTYLYPQSENAEDGIITAIAKQVAAQGTLKEITIFAEAKKDVMVAEALSQQTSSNTVDVKRFLGRLKALQEKTGIKIADRIVFLGCNVFSSQPAAEVGEYRNMAQQLGSELVGATNYAGAIVGGDGLYSKFVQFTPDGQVKYDPALNSSDYNPIIMAIHAYNGRKSEAWAACHVGHTQQEGEACQKKPILEDAIRKISATFQMITQTIPFGSNPEEVQLARDINKLHELHSTGKDTAALGTLAEETASQLTHYLESDAGRQAKQRLKSQNINPDSVIADLSKQENALKLIRLSSAASLDKIQVADTTAPNQYPASPTRTAGQAL